MIYDIRNFNGGLADYEDRGVLGAFKFGSGLDIRKVRDSLSCKQALMDIGVINTAPSSSQSPSASISPSSSPSSSSSASQSPSASVSPSIFTSPSASISPSTSYSPSSSNSPSASISPSSSISPSPSPAPGSKRTFADLVKWFVKCSDGFTYGFGNTGKIYKIGSDFYCQQVADIKQEIKGACQKSSSTGNLYLLFATNTNLHIKQIPGLSNWNDIDKVQDYPKTNLDSTDYHTMKDVAGDIMIANGSKLAMVGYDDSYTNEALDIIPGNIVKTIVERSGRAVMGTYRASDPNNGVNGAIDGEVPLAQIGSNGQIIFANMTDRQPSKRFPGGGKVNPGGVCNEIDDINFFDWETSALSWIDKQTIGNVSLFGVYGASTGKGGIYSYGRYDKAHPFVLNLDYPFDADEIGAVVNANGITMFSYRIGTTFGVKAVDMNNKQTATYDALDFATPIALYRHHFKMPADITAFGISEVRMLPLPAGCAVQFWYQVNKDGTYHLAKTTDGQNSYSAAGGTKANFSIAAAGQTYNPRIVLIPNGNNTAEVNRVVTYFQ